MNADDPRAFLVTIFTRLRASGFRLGVHELLDAAPGRQLGVGFGGAG